ncbi:MAG: Bifunctional uridylyltransferase/uridylyl-removing enzyme [Pseudomonadota bacterium]|jgi:[protein-PII] uridylyltransferase
MVTPDLSALREQVRADKASTLSALRQLTSGRGVKRVLRELTQHTDHTLRQLWLACDMPAECALVAVGGYGRGEQFPHSDVDVLVLLPDTSPDAAHQAQCAERFIGACWDLGLDIGSSVRTIAQCVQEAQADVTVQTALLECRRLIGPIAAVEQLQQALQAVMDPKAFFVAKTLEMRQRHQKFENTPYALEPNCKESPGGLRDLHIVLWVAKAAGLGHTWDDLVHNGLATPLEARQLKANEATLSLVRARLHELSGRREDRLVFDMQNAMAQAFGLHASGGGDAAPTARGMRRASEALMKRYYWAAKAVTQLNQILLLNIEARLHDGDMNVVPLRPINERFFDNRGMLEVAHDRLYIEQPHAVLETFLVYQQTVGIKGLSARTLRALYNARPVMDAAFRRDPVNRATFMAILQQPQGITHAMRLMNQTSVLGRYLWVFRRIVGQMQHDLFHVYTVDQHILMVLRNVRRFFMAEHTHEYPLCSQLAAGWDKPWLLYAAALFHDIAKGRGGDHSQLGRWEVRKFCREHGVPTADAKLIEFLVSEHLTMSHIAQKQDLSDPDVIHAFAQRVGNERYLTALYLLTVADIRGTSPKVWNAWKGKLLEDLYRTTLHTLGGHAPDPDTVVQTRKREALSLLALHTQPFEAHKPLWDTLDVSYFMRHDASDIAWHTRQLSRLLSVSKQEGKPLSVTVRARTSLAGEGMQVLVYAPDQADLFARICGYFDQSGFSILDAKVHTALNGYAIDSFQVIATHEPSQYREWLPMVELGLTQAIVNPQPLPAPSKGRVSRRVKSFPVTPRVALQPDEAAQKWLLSISASDQVGLLYRVAKVLAQHQVSVQLAKVSTLGERVEDIFLISGAALQHNKTQLDIETELLKALTT